MLEVRGRVTKSSAKGYRWERACELFWKARGVEVRRPRAGDPADVGDLIEAHPATSLYGTVHAGVLGWTLQLKNWSRGSFGDGTLWGWWLAVLAQKRNGYGRYAALWVKREGVGHPGGSWAIMSIEEHAKLMEELHSLRRTVRVYQRTYGDGRVHQDAT
jgi:hypothetical protein